MNDAINMQISAFVDGELPQNEAELLLRRLCHDRVLRQQAAEYLAMGRIMRGERSCAGIVALRERIASQLDDAAFESVTADAAPEAPRFLRPLVGVAIAATVAIVALVGLQQVSVDPVAGPSAPVTAAGAADDSYTVPNSVDDPLRDYARSHNASASYIGASSFSPRLVTYQVEDELPVEIAEDQPGDDTIDDTSEDTVEDSASGQRTPTP